MSSCSAKSGSALCAPVLAPSGWSLSVPAAASMDCHFCGSNIGGGQVLCSSLLPRAQEVASCLGN